ncbi:hypothetical protein BRADI_2g26553v3 [Brachypodium distachyon]|uniref:Uncharacterized protein n=1 Tax=Brachypodium distachyon TaxID=15368 RepID=A0A0Q3G566_BRADI|nr:hypothetical protein BRADI_2g26553v3 [Brachypodium distachyon]
MSGASTTRWERSNCLRLALCIQYCGLDSAVQTRLCACAIEAQIPVARSMSVYVCWSGLIYSPIFMVSVTCLVDRPVDRLD